jgi:hypothetical protein
MLALALFIECYKQSLLDLEHNKIESTWLARWKERLGQPARTPLQVMHMYCDVMNITTDTLDLPWIGSAGQSWMLTLTLNE